MNNQISNEINYIQDNEFDTTSIEIAEIYAIYQ